MCQTIPPVSAKPANPSNSMANLSSLSLTCAFLRCLLFTTQGSLWLRVRGGAEEIVGLESAVWNQKLSPKPGFLVDGQHTLFR